MADQAGMAAGRALFLLLTRKSACDLLVHLVEHAGHMGAKHESMNVLWPDTGS